MASSPIGNQIDLTVQYLINDLDSDVRSYFSELATINASTSDMSWTPGDNETGQTQQTPEAGSLSMHAEPSSTISSRMLDFNSPENNGSSADHQSTSGFIELSDSSSSDDSSRDLNTTSASQEITNKLSDESSENVNQQEDEDDDSEDEIIDQTNLSQLRIVNLDEDCNAEEPVTNTENREIKEAKNN